MVILVALIGGAIATLGTMALLAFAARSWFRNAPAEYTRALVGSGTWLRISQRFGVAWAIGLVLASFAWVAGAARFVPDTYVGAWALFGPAVLLIGCGVIAGALRVARWIVDED